MRAILIILSLTLIGCVTSFKHQSDPSVSQDGYNLLCGGFEHRIQRVSGEISGCKNIVGNRGEHFVFEVAYHWSE